MKRKFQRKKRTFQKNNYLKIAGIIAAVILLGIVLIWGMFRVTDVEVVGNSYYSEEEIKEMVLGKDGNGNGLYLMLRYGYMDEEEIPFIDSMEVTVCSRNKVRIRVYEKPIIACVEYMGVRLYFDKDGTVIESSTRVLEGVPCVEGLDFAELTLYEPLNVSDQDVFRKILQVTQLLKKYEVTPDLLSLKEDGQMVLEFGDVRINIGSGEYLDARIATISELESKLEGRSGVMHMEDYTYENTDISFMEDTQELTEDIGESIEDTQKLTEDIGEPIEDTQESTEDIGEPIEDTQEPTEDAQEPETE